MYPTVIRPQAARHAAGFTLIELMIVVALLAILSMIALPAYQNYVLRSKIRLAQSDLLALSANIENFRQRTLGVPSDQAQAERGWAPASRSTDFSFAYSSEGGSYSLKATAGDALGKAAGCELSLDATLARSVSSKCSSVGVSDW
ncbi:type IV pilin protein [Stenotrophomonas sp. NPDC077659]|uniref:type IV pilin protein n=1 Tax=Stenotrophomonas sp. NPDC077659 TaxID=3390694 RepID=UPI003CFF4917